jgi:hypothetical protein
MLKVFPATPTEDAIRKKAAKAGLPITQYLAPFLNAIADGSLVMVPHFPPPGQQQKG